MNLDLARDLLPHLDWSEASPTGLPVLAPPALPLNTIRRALAKAVNPLVLVNDAARLLPRDQPDVLGTLFQERGELPILVATGTHAASLGLHTDRLNGLPLELHDADDASAHIALDDAGTVRIDRRVARADLILAWGSVEPHYFGGWTGAHKTASIGVLDRASIARNHEHALSDAARPLTLEGNPVFDGIAEVLQLLEEDRRVLAINHVLDASGAPVGMACGTWRGSLERALKTARRRFVHTVDAPLDLLVATVRGPLARSLYQADKGLKNTEHAVKDGGALILQADLDQGLGADRFVRLLEQAPDHAAAKAVVSEQGYTLGDHKAVRWRALEDRGVRIHVVSSNLEPDDVAAAGIRVHRSLEDALGEVSADSGRGLLVEDAGNLVVQVVS